MKHIRLFEGFLDEASKNDKYSEALFWQRAKKKSNFFIIPYHGTKAQTALFNIVELWLDSNKKINKNKTKSAFLIDDIFGFTVVNMGGNIYVEHDDKDEFLKVIETYKNSNKYIKDLEEAEKNKAKDKDKQDKQDKKNEKTLKKRLEKNYDLSGVKALTKKDVISKFGEEALDYLDEWYPADENGFIQNELEALVKEWNKRFGTKYNAKDDNLGINIDNELQNRTSLAFIDFIN